MTKKEIIKKYKDKIHTAEHKVGTSKYCTAVASIKEREEFIRKASEFDANYVPDIKFLYAYTKYLATRYKNLNQSFWNEYNAAWRKSNG